MNELIQKLTDLADGQCAVVPYELMEDIFPPGVEDDRAKAAAFTVAKAYGCRIENRPDERAVLFVKGA